MLTDVTHRRPFVLLTVALAAQVLLLALQIRRPGQVRLIRVWAVEVLTPMERAGAWSIGRVGAAWSNYVSLHRARRENERLRAQVGELQMRNAQLESRAAEASRLGALLALREAQTGAPLLAAGVIGAGAGTNRTIYLDRGERDGVQKDMGVITPEGVVGKVLEVYSATAQVLLLTDRESGVGSLLAGTRTQGVALGQGEPLLAMNYVINDEHVTVGERVLTSGMDRIFPKDLPVGTVAEVRGGNPFKVIRVRPAARLDRLEEVFLILSRADWPKAPTAAAPAAIAPPQDSSPQRAKRP